MTLTAEMKTMAADLRSVGALAVGLRSNAAAEMMIWVAELKTADQDSLALGGR